MSGSVPSNRQRRLHYAWVVLISALVLSALSAEVRLSFGVLIDPLVETHGWSRGATSLAYTLTFWSSAVLSLGLGPFIERLGPRRVLLAGIAGITLGLFLTAGVTTLWQLYIYYGVLVGGMSGLTSILLPVAITRWFFKKTGAVLGLYWVSIGVGGVVGPVGFGWLISAAGWRNAFLIAGVIIGSSMLLAVYFFRSRPQDMQTTAYGEEPALSSARDRRAVQAPPPAPAVSFGFVRRNLAFWHLVNIHLLGCVGHSVLLAHVVGIAIFRGVPPLTAAGVLSTMGAVSALSRFITSVMAERFGGRNTLVVAFIMQALPIPLLFFATETWQFYAIAILFGLGYGGEMPAFPIINRQYWGSQSPLNAIYAWQLSGAMLGMGLGGWLGGAFFDITGGYTWSIAVAFLATAIGLAPILALPRHRPGVILAPAMATGVGTAPATSEPPRPS